MAAPSPRSMSAAANSRSPMRKASRFPGWCWPPAPRRRGSTCPRLNVPAAELAGVHTFRDSRDVDLLLTLAAQRKRVVVVGGGLLGLEAGYGLAKAGAAVTLIHLMDRLMERQLDAPAAELLKSQVERKGIRVLLNAETARLHGETRVEGVELADGRRIDADAVIFAAGIRPNVTLAKEAGIAGNRDR